MAACSFTTLTLFSLFILSAFHLLLVSSMEFQVGGNRDWVVPPANDTKFYNDWASEMRFKVGDALRFKYRKDSVMEVTQTDYNKCNSTRPIFFSNKGNTIFPLNRSGYFYFISGASGHCDKGQKMIVKVMAPDHQPSSASTPFVLSKGSFALGAVQFLILFVIPHGFNPLSF